MTRLEKIDILRDRTGLGYAEAASLLDGAEGDLVEALVRFEAREREDASKRAGPSGEFAQRIKALIRKGNVTYVRVKRQDRTVLELPVTASLIGALIAPELVMVASAACLFTRCTVELERTDGRVDVHEFDAERNFS